MKIVNKLKEKLSEIHKKHCSTYSLKLTVSINRTLYEASITPRGNPARRTKNKTIDPNPNVHTSLAKDASFAAQNDIKDSFAPLPYVGDISWRHIRIGQVCQAIEHFYDVHSGYMAHPLWLAKMAKWLCSDPARHTFFGGEMIVLFLTFAPY